VDFSGDKSMKNQNGKKRESDVRICQDDPSPAGIFYCEFGFAVLACYPADGAGQMVPVECFDVFYLERVEVEVV
jgi:hypothetical protein